MELCTGPSVLANGGEGHPQVPGRAAVKLPSVTLLWVGKQREGQGKRALLAASEELDCRSPENDEQELDIQR